MSKLFINYLKNNKKQSFSSIITNNPIFSQRFYSKSSTLENLKDSEFEEVEISVPWGHIAGVRWGPTDVQPILALHGWQDNAFTWKPLINNLPKNVSILAIDFPGHGKSSWHPPGMCYSHMENIFTIRRIKKYFDWKSVALLGHSMGAISSFIYGSLFPNEIHYAILLDNLKPIIPQRKDPIANLSNEISKFLDVDSRNLKQIEPPSYDFDTMVKKLYIGGHKSVDKDKCHILLERAIRRSTIDPQKYYFRRDSRLKHIIFLRPNKDDLKVMAERVHFPILHFKFQSSTYFEPEENYFEIFDIVKKTSKDFEFHSVPGTHHGHINDPSVISPFINEFIKKYNLS